MLVYKNPITGEIFEVRVHNFSKNHPENVRIMGHMDLNPEDKNYPDKKWVLKSELFNCFNVVGEITLLPKVFDEDEIKAKTFY